MKAICLVLLTATLLLAQDAHWQPLRSDRLELSLTRQDGQPVALYSGLLKDHTVVVNFVFTNCTKACPMLTTQFRSLQTELAKRRIDGVRLVSVSVDPERDSAAALAKFARSFGAQADWTFLTGSPSQIEQVLGVFGLPLQQRDGHTSRFVVSNGTTGVWTAVDGFTSIPELLTLVEQARAGAAK